jgi:hypothetical protein
MTGPETLAVIHLATHPPPQLEAVPLHQTSLRYVWSPSPDGGGI